MISSAHGFSWILKIKHHLSFLCYHESYQKRFSSRFYFTHNQELSLKKRFFMTRCSAISPLPCGKQDAWSFLLELLLPIQMLGGIMICQIKSCEFLRFINSFYITTYEGVTTYHYFVCFECLKFKNKDPYSTGCNR